MTRNNATGAEDFPKQTASPVIDESSDIDFDSEHDHGDEKDETELELEKLVFGDDAGFREGLKSYQREGGVPESDEASGEQGGKVRDNEGAAGDEDIETLNDADLFFVDSGQSIVGSNALLTKILSGEDEEASEGEDPPAWVDSDDERITVSLATNPRLRKLRLNEGEDLVNGKEYSKRLRRQFERLYPVPDWAKPLEKGASSRRKRRKLSDTSSGSDEVSSEDGMSIDSDDLSAQPLAKLLQSTDSMIQFSNTRKKLRPDTIDIQRTKDVGGNQPSAITSLSFHPTAPLLLSSGPSSTLTLNHISPSAPVPNPILTTLHIRSTPLTTSLFTPTTGTHIFFSGRRRHFHTWDLSTGRIAKISTPTTHADEQRTMERFKLSPDARYMGLVGSGRKGGGIINILDAHTCQWLSQVRVEGKGGVADFAWWADSAGLVVFGKGGEAVEYSMAERRVLHRWIDDGGVGITVVAMGGTSGGKHGLGGDRWLAVGSSSGMVNLYDRKAWSGAVGGMLERPKPSKVFGQLTTAISHLVFAGDGQLLVMGSRWKRDALRLIHLPSCTVYRNWPTAATPLGRISAVAMSPSSEMLAVANEQGKIRLWEIRS